MTENELLLELTNLLKLEPVASDEVTVNMLATSLNITKCNARIKLQKLEKEGKLTSRMATSQKGKAVLAFKKIEPLEK